MQYCMVALLDLVGIVQHIIDSVLHDILGHSMLKPL